MKKLLLFSVFGVVGAVNAAATYEQLIQSFCPINNQYPLTTTQQAYVNSAAVRGLGSAAVEAIGCTISKANSMCAAAYNGQVVSDRGSGERVSVGAYFDSAAAASGNTFPSFGCPANTTSQVDNPGTWQGWGCCLVISR